MTITLQQSLFPAERPPVPVEAKGVVYTKPWVIDLILDLVGYTPDQPLFDRILVEPSAGEGSFLSEIVRRLLESVLRHGGTVSECAGCIVAFELDPRAACAARQTVVETLHAHGVATGVAESLSNSWVRCGDFLLESSLLIGQVEWVVGNPPYVRLEDLPQGGAVYRDAFPTMVGRADLYVAFFEAAIRLLRPNGRCGFICADRWMFNQYGSSLRRFVTANCSVEAILQMHHADAFEATVSAYPAVSILRRALQGAALVGALAPEAERAGGTRLAAAVRLGDGSEVEGLTLARIETWFEGNEPWPLLSPEGTALLKRLESAFPTLEETGATVGIGVATGADKVFVTRRSDLVESSRLLPLAMASDAKGTHLTWSGHYLVDPWQDGKLVDLRLYPRLREYLEGHRTQLAGRHVGRRNTEGWFRTIDRVHHELVAQPKLYLPDIKGRIAPVLDTGGTYPHHNLYFVSPRIWDAEVLGGLLLSDVAQFFVASYGVRMRGGYLRFQAQYLRRIRIPHPATLSEGLQGALRLAFATHDVRAANEAATEIYGLSPSEVALLAA